MDQDVSVGSWYVHKKAYLRGGEVVSSELDGRAIKTDSTNILVRFAAGPDGNRTNVLLARVHAIIRIEMHPAHQGPAGSATVAAVAPATHRLAIISCYQLSSGNSNSDAANKVVWQDVLGNAGQYCKATNGRFYWTGAVDLRSIDTKVAMGRAGESLTFYKYNKMSGVQGHA